MNCACTSVGNPGYGAVLTFTERIGPSLRTRTPPAAEFTSAPELRSVSSPTFIPHTTAPPPGPPPPRPSDPPPGRGANPHRRLPRPGRVLRGQRSGRRANGPPSTP